MIVVSTKDQVPHCNYENKMFYLKLPILPGGVDLLSLHD